MTFCSILDPSLLPLQFFPQCDSVSDSTTSIPNSNALKRWSPMRQTWKWAVIIVCLGTGWATDDVCNGFTLVGLTSLSTYLVSFYVVIKVPLKTRRLVLLQQVCTFLCSTCHFTKVISLNLVVIEQSRPYGSIRDE